MGFHVCEYCRDATSSGDVTLNFGPGHVYQMPDMITHYVEVHQYLPPSEFIDAVLHKSPTQSSRGQTKSLSQDTRTLVGYLSGPFPKGETPPEFLASLKRHLALARENGDRSQTRGLKSDSPTE